MYEWAFLIFKNNIFFVLKKILFYYLKPACLSQSFHFPSMSQRIEYVATQECSNCGRDSFILGRGFSIGGSGGLWNAPQTFCRECTATIIRGIIQEHEEEERREREEYQHGGVFVMEMDG